MTTSEKAEVAARIGRELGHIVPRPPALRVFDAGTGNGMVLSQVLRDLHRRLPTVPFFVVGKEVSMEDTRLTLATLPDRLAEHPQSVVVLTNMFYAEAPHLFPKAAEFHDKVRWIDVPLKGNSVARVLPADPRARRPPHAGLADGIEREDRQPRLRHAVGDGAVSRRPGLRAQRPDPAADRRSAAVRVRPRAGGPAVSQPHVGARPRSRTCWRRWPRRSHRPDGWSWSNRPGHDPGHGDHPQDLAGRGSVLRLRATS